MSHAAPTGRGFAGGGGMTGYQPIVVEIDGRSYAGAWRLEVGMVQVSSAYGAASGAAGPHPAHVAERLLREIVAAELDGAD